MRIAVHVVHSAKVGTTTAAPSAGPICSQSRMSKTCATEHFISLALQLFAANYNQA